MLAPGRTGSGGTVTASSGGTVTDKVKNEKVRNMDDIKLYFLKGLLQGQHSSGTASTATTGRPGTGQTPWNTRPGYNSYNPGPATTTSPAKVKHNRVYSASDIIQKFGNPTSRSSTATTEVWAYKCKDGTVRLHFTQVGVGYARNAAKSETLRLEIKSVDSSFGSSPGSSRF